MESILQQLTNAAKQFENALGLTEEQDLPPVKLKNIFKSSLSAGLFKSAKNTSNGHKILEDVSKFKMVRGFIQDCRTFFGEKETIEETIEKNKVSDLLFECAIKFTAIVEGVVRVVAGYLGALILDLTKVAVYGDKEFSSTQGNSKCLLDIADAWHEYDVRKI